MIAGRRRWLLAAAALPAGAALPGCAGSGPAPAGAPVAARARDPIPPGMEEVPYVQTPQTVVDAMLGLAGVRAGDRLLDLGSGDGRVVIGAARRFGVPGLGVELDPQLVELSRSRARAAGVGELARFAVQDLFDTDLGSATVITLYLLPDVNLALRPRLLRLAPGTRIVSHDWDMADWAPDRSLTVPAPGKPVGRLQQSTLHLWIVPAPLAGRWQGGLAGGRPDALTLDIGQRFQQLTIDWRLQDERLPGVPAQTRVEARLNGDQASFALGEAGRASLRLRNGVLEGEVATAVGPRRWRAVRQGPAGALPQPAASLARATTRRAD
jgi:SAM-dependent methyltransferase